MYGYSKLLFLQDKKIIVYKRGVKDKYYTNNWSFDLYNTKEAIYTFLNKGYHLLYKKYSGIEIDNLQAIKDISYDIETAILLIDKDNKALCVYDGEKIIHKIILKDIPKLAIYNNEKDKIYVVYENKKGLDILSKKENKIYVRLQNIAKEKISKAVLPFWKYRFSEHIKDIDILREYLTGSIDADFDYKVNEYSDRYEVFVTSKDRGNINIKFTFVKKDKITVDKISYPKKQKNDISFLEEMGYIEK